jgi:hypothetical protein
MRLLARRFSLDEGSIVAWVAKGNDEAALSAIASAHQLDELMLQEAYALCAEEARRQLIRELGNPAPYRLL